MKYKAITLDTSFIYGNGFKFNKGAMRELSQFKDSGFDFILSEIVYWEAFRHLEGNSEKISDSLKKSKRNLADTYFVPNENLEVIETFINAADPKACLLALESNTGLEVISYKGVDSGELADLYFEGKELFGKGRKRNEFPDAIALLSLEAWAEKNKKKILAVSQDGDWLKWAEQSEWIDCLKDLGEALEHFQEPLKLEKSRKLVLSLLDVSDGSVIYQDTLCLVKQYFEDIPYFDVEADSRFFWEDSDHTLVAKFLTFEKDDDGLIFKILNIGAEEIQVEVGISVEADASCFFSLTHPDISDGVPISMGCVDKHEEVKFKGNCVLLVDGENNIFVESVDIDIEPVYFGEVHWDD